MKNVGIDGSTHTLINLRIEGYTYIPSNSSVCANMKSLEVDGSIHTLVNLMTEGYTCIP